MRLFRSIFGLLSLLSLAQCDLFDVSSCGISKACFLPLDANCYQGCNGMGVAYSFYNTTVMDIEIFGNTATDTGFYFAVGFSIDDMMGNESVIECSSLGTDPLSMKFSYNIGKEEGGGEPTNVRIPDQSKYEIFNSSASIVDGSVYCKGRFFVGGSGQNGRVFHYDPKQMYYLLMANGPTEQDGLRHHIHDTTSDQLNLEDIRPGFSSGSCGVGKGCFIPNKDDCYGHADMAMSYRTMNSTHLFVELWGRSNQSTARYVAVGFSDDMRMGNESVIECSSLGPEPLSMKFSYNDGTPKNVRIPGEKALRPKYISDQSDYQDGYLFCSGVVDVSGSSKNNEIFHYNPTQQYYLLMASGPANASGVQVHDVSCATKVALSLTENEPSFDVSQCNKTKGCFLPENCYKGCNGMAFSYQMLSQSTMRVEILSVAPTLSLYVALGFSLDQQMGDDHVIECSSIGNASFSIKYSYNTATNPTNVRIPGEETVRATLIQDETVSFQDGLLYCAATINVGGSSVSDEIFKYNSSILYYFLMASGPTDDKGLRHHQHTVFSNNAYNLSSTELVNPVTTPTPSPNSNNINCGDCGKVKGCFFPNGNCNGHGFTYKMTGPSMMEVELVASPSTAQNDYIAVGFSNDQYMPSVPVLECSSLSGQSLSMKFSYNNNQRKNVRITDEPAIRSVMITPLEATSHDGIKYCRATVNVSGWAGNDEIFHLDQNALYYLLLAYGPTDANGLQYHKWKTSSSSAVNLTAIQSIKGRGGLSDVTRQRLRTAHGILMILSWLCFVPAAILFARFLRNSWPLVKPAGLLVWFHVHRTANLFGILLMISSFVCILTANDWKWTGPGSPIKSTTHWEKVHSMTGLFALMFAWLQPFISTIRCSPNNPKRPIFNWVHRGIGIIAFALATTAMSIAAYHFNYMWSQPDVQLCLSLFPLFMMTLLCVVIPIVDKLQEKTASEGTYQTLEFSRQVMVLTSLGLIVGDTIALCVMLGMQSD